MSVRLQTAPFDPGAETNAFLAAAAGAGAAVTFTGLVRSRPDDPVSTLTLEVYPELAEAQLSRAIAEAVTRFALLRATVIHRYGPLAAGRSGLDADVGSLSRARRSAAGARHR